ncbi:unnamed protein product [Polarella glacialis]|uniref:Uncharacterized protein n=1 Tax=Polarella glacialis TaxID=89957 RepID=A0A813DQF6_POLGL|nr:unnamed protein product [Polarella glacialis]
MPHSGRETTEAVIRRLRAAFLAKIPRHASRAKEQQQATATTTEGKRAEQLEKIPACATLAIVAVEAYGIAKPATAQQQQQKRTMNKTLLGKSAYGPQCVGLTSTRHLLSSTSWMVST